MNPIGTVVGNLRFITKCVETFVTNTPDSRIFPLQIQNWTLFLAIRKRRSITLQRAFISCTHFQTLLRLTASCNFPLFFFRCCLPCCCFLANKGELGMLCTMLLLSMPSSMISTHRIHRHADFLLLIHIWAACLAALRIPSQLLPFQAKRYGLTPLHSVRPNLLSRLHAARPVFSKKSHKTTPCNAGSCNSFLENCYV